MSHRQTQQLLAEQFKYPDDDVILHLDKKPKRVSFLNKTEKSNKKKKKIPFTEKLFNKINSYINDLKEIDKVVPFCQEKNRKELLLDRGLLLCLKVNEIVEDSQLKMDEALNYKKNEKIDVDLKLLDENYWMNQKVDKYARTEQRQRIPQEKWFMLKDNSFTPNLMKCFDLNRTKFIETYNWLQSLENKNN
jgi:vacuolar-type H+-ATPase subunit I/STV1